jgi:O-antigen/teichoic acid export membrane protein
MTVSDIAIQRYTQPVRRLFRSDFVRHGVLVFAATMACNVLNYVFNFALSRRLGIEGFATLSSLTGGLMIVSVPSAIWNLLVVKYAADYHAASDGAKLRRLGGMLLAWGAVIALAIFVAGVFLRGVVSDFLHIPNDGTIVLWTLLAALGFLMPSVRGVLQGSQDFKRFSISTTLEVFLKVGFGVGLAYAGFGVLGAVGGWLVGTMLALFYTVWAVHGSKRNAVAPGRLRLDLGRLARTTAGIALSTSMLTLLSFMDVVLVKHYFSAREAGLYAAVNLTGKVVLFLVSFLPLIVLPKAAAQVERGQSPLGLLGKAAAVTIAMSGITLALFGMMPAEALRIFAGRVFVIAAPYVFQYDLAMAVLACITLLVNYRIALHRFGFLVPLAAILIAEVTAVAAFHSTLWEIIHILLFGNVAALLVCSYRITSESDAGFSKGGLKFTRST